MANFKDSPRFLENFTILHFYTHFVEKKRYGLAALSLTAAFGLMACGDDTTNNNYSTVAIEDYTLKTLPKCDSTMEGQVGFVTTTEELMYCMDGEWMNLNGADGDKGKQGAKRRPQSAAPFCHI